MSNQSTKQFYIFSFKICRNILLSSSSNFSLSFLSAASCSNLLFCSCSSSDLSLSSLSFRSALLSVFCSSICTAERRVALFLVTLPFLPVSERHQEQSMRECPFFVYFILFFFRAGITFRKSHIKAAISEHFSCEPKKCTQMEEEGLLLRVASIIESLKGSP